MNTKSTRLEKGILRSTGGGALTAVITGLIFLAPLSARGQDACYDEAFGAGRHHVGAVHAGPNRFARGMRPSPPGMDIELMTIVLDLSEKQVEEVKEILEEHQEKMDDQLAEAWKQRRRTARKNRVHRRGGCDRVEREELRSERREHREEMAEARGKMREKLDDSLAGILDDGQMEKLRELRELRETRRQERLEMREQRRETREERIGRSGRRGRRH